LLYNDPDAYEDRDKTLLDSFVNFMEKYLVAKVFEDSIGEDDEQPENK